MGLPRRRAQVTSVCAAGLALTACAVVGRGRLEVCWCAGTRRLALTRRRAAADSAPDTVGEDWRDFRARLVAQERAEDSESTASVASSSIPQSDSPPAVDSAGWAFATPLVEEGSMLLSRPNARFALAQQYFHKAVIFIVKHNADGDLGLILNRPTTLSTEDLGLPGPSWPIWFGGDCQGVNDLRNGGGNIAAFCLHTSQEHASRSREVINGVFLSDFQHAFDLVQAGSAKAEDFMLLVGYCGWGEGQLQRELDGGEAWTLASVDKKLVVRELHQAPGESGALSSGTTAWGRLYTALGEQCQDEDAGVQLLDLMLEAWVKTYLEKW